MLARMRWTVWSLLGDVALLEDVLVVLSGSAACSASIAARSVGRFGLILCWGSERKQRGRRVSILKGGRGGKKELRVAVGLGTRVWVSGGRWWGARAALAMV